jgi:hypothetical protein
MLQMEPHQVLFTPEAQQQELVTLLWLQVLLWLEAINTNAW